MVRQAVRQMLNVDPSAAAGQGFIVRGAGRPRVVKVTSRLEAKQAVAKTGSPAYRSRAGATVSWAHILKAIASAELEDDRVLAKQVSVVSGDGQAACSMPGTKA